MAADDPRDRSRAYASAGAVFLDEGRCVLLVEPTYKDAWEIPGGYVETGETPVQGCAREVREELGLDLAVGRLLAALAARRAGTTAYLEHGLPPAR